MMDKDKYRWLCMKVSAHGQSFNVYYSYRHGVLDIKQILMAGSPYTELDNLREVLKDTVISCIESAINRAYNRQEDSYKRQKEEALVYNQTGGADFDLYRTLRREVRVISTPPDSEEP